MFAKRNASKVAGGKQHQQNNHNTSDYLDNNNVTKAKGGLAPQEAPVNRTQLIFHCQLAHGSPTGLISGFSNVKELYQKIAESFDVQASEILFCTLNTHKIDMKKLLGGQIGLDDLIFAHMKGRPKEIEIVKSEEALGLTITDNGTGYAFIKRIKEGSIIDRIPHIEVGDHIEKLDGISVVGKRHFEVAKMLKEIQKDTTFTIRLVEPVKSGFGSIGPRGDPRGKKKGGYGTGKETVRFKADGRAVVSEKDDIMEIAVEHINNSLELLWGINDSELAMQIWELADGTKNPAELAEAIDDSDLESFGFTDEFIFELWGIITDARAGRLKANN